MDLFSVYYLVLFVYAAAYVMLFGVPLLRSLGALDPGKSLDSMKRLLDEEAKAEREERRMAHAVAGDGTAVEVASLEPALALVTADGDAPPDDATSDALPKTRRLIGDAFVGWCRENKEALSHRQEFANHLSSVGASLMVSAAHHHSDGLWRLDPEFEDEPPTHWVVADQDEAWLLPAPHTYRAPFDASRSVAFSHSEAVGREGISASDIEVCTPATLRMVSEEDEEVAFEVERRGRLSNVTLSAGVGGDGVAGGDPSAAPRSKTAQSLALERLASHRALTAQYKSAPLVQDAVDALRVQYPGGAYASVQVERLPTYLAYAERLGAARTMAGLFVLLGLVLTMMKLNGVVGDIGGAATEALDQDGFLAAMSEIMNGVGGAFLSSIGGLWLMLIALGFLAIVDIFARRRVGRVERALAGEMVPALADLHRRLTPDLSLGDLLSTTRDGIRGLNRAVEGVTDGMVRSLADLGGQIHDMLQDFGSFEKEYSKLDGLLGDIKAASKDLRAVAGGLKGATDRLIDPLDQFNRDVGQHLGMVREHLDVIGEATASNADGYRETREHIVTVQAHSDETLDGLKALVRGQAEDAAKRQEASFKALDEHTRRTADQLDRAVKALEAASASRSAAPVVVRGSGSGGGSGSGVMAPHDGLPPTLFLWVAGGVRAAYRWTRRKLR